MNIRRIAIALLLAVTLAATGCSDTSTLGKAEADPEQSAAIEITDLLGRKVRLDEPARRIAALSPGFVETLFAVGCGDRIVLRDLWSDFPPEALAIPMADGLKPSVRHVSGFHPDLVLLYANDATLVTPFEKVGLEVAVLDPRSYDQVVDDVIKIGALCGSGDRAAAIAARMRRTRDDVRERVGQFTQRPLVYVEIDGADPVRPWTAGPGSFVHELLNLAGARNVGAEASSAYAQVSAESVIRADPQIVLLLDAGHPGDTGSAQRIADRPGWSELAAVREGRVIEHIDPDLLSRPGPRLADGLSALFGSLHGRGR